MRRVVRIVMLLGVVGVAAGILPRRPTPFKLAPGWKIELVAEAPAIRFPTAIAVAPDGTIYLGQDPMDMPGPPTVPADSVVAIKNGRVRVFAENLWAAMGLEWVEGTLYVVHAPYLSAFRDTDGDGRADQRVDLVTGLGPPIPGFNGLNNHIASGIRLGIDGYLYISIGDKGIPRGVGRDGTTIRLHGGGVIRVRPDGSGLEVVSTGERNPLSVALSDTDEIFTYGNDDGSNWPNSLTHHIVGGHYGYPDEFLEHPERALPIMGGRVGGAGAQGLCYNEDGLAERFHGNLFFCDWGRRTLIRYELEKCGGTFKVKDQEFVVRKGTINEFRPFSIAVGDGGNSLFLVDWAFSGFLVAGPQTGRLYRLTYTGPDSVRAAPRPTGPSVADRLVALDHPALSVRLAAQRALAAQSQETEGPLLASLRGRGARRSRLHALWALDAIGTMAARQAIREALTDADAEIRSQAARSAGIRRDRQPSAALTGLLRDASPICRRAAAIALGRIGDRGVIWPLLAALGDPDPFVDWSIRRAIRALGTPEAGTLADALVDLRRRESALRLCDEWWSVVVARALVMARERSCEAAWRSRLVATLASLYRCYPEWTGYWFGPTPLAGERPRKTSEWEPEGMTEVFEGLVAALDDPAPAVRRSAIGGLADVGPRALPRLRAALRRERDPANLALLVQAMGRLGDRESVPVLRGLLKDPRGDEQVRAAALDVIQAAGGPNARVVLREVARDAAAPLPLVARSISALGREGFLSPGELETYLDHADPTIRIAALTGLGSPSTPSICRAIIGRLDDPCAEVRLVAIRRAGSLKIRAAIPRLLELSGDAAFRAEAISALAAVPDPAGMDVYLKALDDRAPDVRRAGDAALNAIRDLVAETLRSRVQGGQLSEQAALAVERVLVQFQPVTEWRVIGPFPSNMGRPFANPDAIDFTGSHVGALGRVIAWTERQGETATGRVVIDDLKSHAGGRADSGFDQRVSADLAAVGVANLGSDEDRSALLLAGSSGTITITVNGSVVLHTDSNAGRVYAPSSDTARITLRKGSNRIMVQSRQGIGAWSFSVQVSDRSDPGVVMRSAPKTRESLRTYARSHAGVAIRGEALFFDPNGIGCVKCHTAGRRGSARIGPDLSGLSLKYDREEIVRSVLEPSSRIASGYQPVLIARTDGTVLTGLVRGETATDIELVGPDLKPVRVSLADIDERRTADTSLMPAGLVDALSPDEFADLIAFLESLR